jgi:WD40 repeat protein
MADTPRYRAFISYSHRDKAWGDWLHHALETYRVPKSLVGRPSRDGAIPARLYPIFRDREELPVSADLGHNIAEALAASQYLIVVCSPNAASSRWVNEEILTFKRLGRADRVLALIVDGEPNAADGKPGVPAEAECFPEGLRYRVGEDGALSDLRTEPIAADARDDKDGRQNAKLKLIAGLLGVNFDDLRQRENERRVRRLRRLVAATTAVIALFAGISIYAGWQAAIARQERARADEKLADAYTLRARQALLEGDDMSASVLFAEAYRSHPADWTAANAMGSARTAARLRARLAAPGSAFWVELASDGARAFATDDGGAISVLDLESASVAGTLPLEKKSEARSIVWSPDRRKVATLGVDEVIRLWDSDTLKPAVTISEPGTKFIELTFSQDGRDVIAWDEHSERRWSVERGDSMGPPRRMPIRVGAVSVSPDRSKALLRDDKGKQIQFWDLAARAPLGNPQATDSWVVAWSADGTLTAIGQLAAGKARDGDVSLWEARTGRRRVTLPGAGAVKGFSPDSSLVLTARDDQTAKYSSPEHGAEMRLWSASTGAPVGAAMAHSQDLWAAVFSPDGRFIASTSNDTVVRFWSVPDGRTVAALRHGQPVYALAWPAKTTVVCEGLNELSVWDVGSRFAEPLMYPMRGALSSAGFSPDGSRFFAGGQLWNAATLARVGDDVSQTSRQSFQGFSPNAKYAYSTGLNVSDGATITGSEFMFARVWDAATGAPVGNPLAMAEAWNLYSRVVFTPDESRVATWMADRLQVRNVATGEVVGKPVDGTKLYDFGFTPDGTEIVGAAIGAIGQRWRAATGELIDAGWPAESSKAVLSPAAGRILTHAPLRLWDLATRKLIVDLKIDDASLMTFSRDGRRFAATNNAGARVWNSATGAQIGQTIPLGPVAAAMTFSADDRWLAIAGKDNTVRIFDAESGEGVGAPLRTAALVDVLAFEPNGRRLLTGSRQESARLFDVSYLYDRVDPQLHLQQLEQATGLRLSLRGEVEAILAAEWTARNRK